MIRSAFAIFLFIIIITFVQSQDLQRDNSGPEKQEIKSQTSKEGEVILERSILNLRSPGAIEEIENSISEPATSGEISNENDEIPVMRTATGGFVNTIMVYLTVLAFIGNGAFMIDVFWLSR